MKYETPICEILKFSEEDIIRTSYANGSHTAIIGWKPNDMSTSAND